MRKIIIFCVIMAVLMACVGYIVVNGEEYIPFGEEIKAEKLKQEKAHEAAEILRELGFEENSESIKELQKIWWAAQEKIKEFKSYEYLGRFKAYGYCPCGRCCGSYASGITATGTTATEGRTIAVDPDVIPLGSRVLINGKEYIAEDTGSGINGRKIDIYFESHSAALEWGVRYVDVYGVK